jgi:hypothetical protein
MRKLNDKEDKKLTDLLKQLVSDKYQIWIQYQAV